MEWDFMDSGYVLNFNRSNNQISVILDGNSIVTSSEEVIDSLTIMVDFIKSEYELWKITKNIFFLDEIIDQHKKLVELWKQSK
jgi:hypothetical protein